MKTPGETGPQSGKKADTPKGVHSRGYLPHYDVAYDLQFVTFRLADSLNQDALHDLETELKHLKPSARNQERRKKIQQLLDAGIGCCALKHPQVAAMMMETLQKFHPVRYQLIAWCIMPNHVHVLIQPTLSLSRIVQSWKSYTGRWAISRNAVLGLGIPGTAFWMRDYWDRHIRNDEHLRNVVDYIHDNPVKAGLCNHPQDWRWSSANAGLQPDKSESLGESRE